MNRPRNLWSPEEDNTLKKLVETCAEKDKVDWRRIASFLPGRNNKDCRKRWHYRVSATMNLGPWSPSEDDLLRIGIGRHGTHWSRVAQVVVTRNGDQCFKRWNDVLDPAINRSPWTRDEDRRLLDAIEKHGRAWKHIVDTHFPGRTGLDAKNRHRQLTRKRKREHQPPTKSSRTVKREQLSSQQQSQIQGQARTQRSTQQYIAQTVPSLLSQLSPTSSSSPSLSIVATPTVLISPQQNPIDILSVPALGAGSPAFASLCWDSPIDGMFGPSLPLSIPTPATPYSPCSSSLSNSTFESSPSQYNNEDHLHHPHPSQQFDSRELLAHEVPVQFPYFHNSTSHSRMLDVDIHSQHPSLLQSHQHTFSDPHWHSHSHSHSHTHTHTHTPSPSHMHSPQHVQMHRMQSRSVDEMLPLYSDIVVSSPFHTGAILSTHNLNHHQSYPVDGFGY